MPDLAFGITFAHKNRNLVTIVSKHCQTIKNNAGYLILSSPKGTLFAIDFIADEQEKKTKYYYSHCSFNVPGGLCRASV